MKVENKEIVIASAVRTAVGRAGGSLRNVDSGHLGSTVIQEAVSRARIEKADVDEVILGEVRQTTASSNVARVAALRAGVPESKPAFTVNRLCASSMQAIGSGVQQILFGQADVVVAGGTENMSQAPMYLRNTRYGEGVQKLVDSNLEAGQQPMDIYGDKLGMGATAENVADRYEISREDQDAFAFESQEKAKRALENETFADEIVPVEVKERKRSFTFSVDEHPRETSTEKLASLKPAFKADGSVTAGNACGRNDGASALVLMTKEKAEALGVAPMATIVDWTAVGVDPEVMGIGPVPAVELLLERTGKQKEDIGVWELNEAFASQSLAVIRELGLPEVDVNRNGGAIALGHPLGATGARITTSLLYEMKRKDERFGIATLCVGGGQGMALMLERDKG
ncbi:thiolase family protein [Salicibibacter cibarius]|uniref:acetyl-CoA C-acetyltransferase n=1 Tax=Salicibibacter cibarius TaxID=2743000 RepID=A0A7T6Z5M5_9BACI|nr:thiolase family protein [Salicibibacter cibarius]QQK77428.1 thiolase family protein [Salicibibacter cibarius]